MKNRYIKKIRKTSTAAWILFLLVSIMPSVSSCSLDIPPADQYSDPDAITHVAAARSLLSSAYASYPNYQYEFSILGPDFCQTPLVNKDMEKKNLYLWQDKSISEFAESVWLGYYRTVAYCDVLLERMPGVMTGNAQETLAKKQIEAEAKTLKALCYFNLLRIFAPAYDINPEADGIILKNMVGLEDKGRSSIKTCVAAIRTWLNEALAVENAPERNGWISQQAVRYLLAELELYAGNYSEAKTHAGLLLADADDSYFRKEGYERLWKEASCRERIFAFYTVQPFYAGLEYGRTEGDYFGLSPRIRFQEEDIRADMTVYPFEMNGASRSLLGKYNRMNKEEKTIRYINTMRYAGAVFIMAEACSRIPEKEQEGKACLNHYLELCGAEVLPEELTGSALTQRILEEKMKEFVGEGTNYFDCKRIHAGDYPRWDNWGVSQSLFITAGDYRWTFPIPRSEYRYNEAVTQNDGWPLIR